MVERKFALELGSLFSRSSGIALGALTAIAAFAISGCGPDVRSARKSTNTQPTAEIVASGPASEVLNQEGYDAVQENAFLAALEQPQSTFSIDVDTASYANVRRMIRQGTQPPKGAVRLEEFVNYFPYDYPEPDSEHPFSVTTQVADCPWNHTHQLLQIAIQGRKGDRGERGPCNLVFLIDTSGSMAAANKLPLVKSSLTALVHDMRPEDRIAIVTYAGSSGLALDSTPGTQKDNILLAIQSLTPGGATNGGAGIQLAYQTALANFQA